MYARWRPEAEGEAEAGDEYQASGRQLENGIGFAHDHYPGFESGVGRGTIRGRRAGAGRVQVDDPFVH